MDLHDLQQKYIGMASTLTGTPKEIHRQIAGLLVQARAEAPAGACLFGFGPAMQRAQATDPQEAR